MRGAGEGSRDATVRPSQLMWLRQAETAKHVKPGRDHRMTPVLLIVAS